MKIENGDSINRELGTMSIVGGIAQVPMFTYLDATMSDDIMFTACSYVNSADGYYYRSPDTFTVQYA
jgi:hypothetical protein